MTDEIAEILRSNEWGMVVEVRRGRTDAYLRFLWYRAQWRANPTKERERTYRQVEELYTGILRSANALEAAMMRELQERGVDVHALPEDPDQCTRCQKQVSNDYGCGCTNVIAARKSVKAERASH